MRVVALYKPILCGLEEKERSRCKAGNWEGEVSAGAALAAALGQECRNGVAQRLSVRQLLLQNENLEVAQEDHPGHG